MKIYTHKPLEVEAIRWNLENARELETFIGKNPFHKYQCFEDGRLVIILPDQFSLVLELGDWLVSDWKGKLFVKRNKDFEREFQLKG